MPKHTSFVDTSQPLLLQIKVLISEVYQHPYQYFVDVGDLQSQLNSVDILTFYFSNCMEQSPY
jgi:hypothetical protein